MHRAFLLFLILNLISVPAFCQYGKSLELTAGLSKAPFVIYNNGDNEGIQLDVIKSIFSTEKQDVSFIHLPLARSFSNIEKWHSDGTITLPSGYERRGVYLTDPYIHYQKVLITLAEDELVINDLNDLAGKNIIAFQTATHFLGEEFINALEAAEDYREMADQEKQIEMLFVKRTQVLVLDITIFKYFLLTHQGEKYSKAYNVHPLFEPSHYSAGFKSEAVRDQFNRGLKVIKENGTYQQIINKYRH
jgi:polar amino acid transport system substrate-binding protein